MNCFFNKILVVARRFCNILPSKKLRKKTVKVKRKISQAEFDYYYMEIQDRVRNNTLD